MRGAGKPALFRASLPAMTWPGETKSANVVIAPYSAASPLSPAVSMNPPDWRAQKAA